VEQARDQVAEQHQHHTWIRSRFDLAVAVLLGLTVMAIAWGAYRAEVKGKDAEHYFNRSEETIAAAHKVELQGDQEVATDEQLFLELERDRAEGRARSVTFIRQLMTAELAAAVRWWEQQPAATRPSTPFVDGNPSYRNRFYIRGGALESRAAHYREQAHQAEERRIDYTIVSVLLTVGLFVLGLSTQLLVPWVRLGLVGFGAVILVGALVRFVDLGT